MPGAATRPQQIANLTALQRLTAATERSYYKAHRELQLNRRESETPSPAANLEITPPAPKSKPETQPYRAEHTRPEPVAPSKPYTWSGTAPRYVKRTVTRRQSGSFFQGRPAKLRHHGNPATRPACVRSGSFLQNEAKPANFRHPSSAASLRPLRFCFPDRSQTSAASGRPASIRHANNPASLRPLRFLFCRTKPNRGNPTRNPYFWAARLTSGTPTARPACVRSGSFFQNEAKRPRQPDQEPGFFCRPANSGHPSSAASLRPFGFVFCRTKPNRGNPTRNPCFSGRPANLRQPNSAASLRPLRFVLCRTKPNDRGNPIRNPGFLAASPPNIRQPSNAASVRPLRVVFSERSQTAAATRPGIRVLWPPG